MNKKNDHRSNSLQCENKIVYLEAMRILACFFVIFNHTSNKGFFLFSTKPLGGGIWWIYILISVFCKFSVPLFWAISGALLLCKSEYSLKNLWIKRILKIVFLLFIYSAIYYIRKVLIGDEDLNVSRFLSVFYMGNWNHSYWYLYSFIAYLMCLPFLRTLAQNLSDQNYYYMFCLVIIFKGLIPIMQYIIFKDKYILYDYLIPEWLATDIVIYPCLGYFLETRYHISGKKIILLWCIDIITIFLTCFTTYLKIIYEGVCSETVSQTFYYSFVFINCVTIYVTVKWFISKILLSQKIIKIICVVGNNTLGIYLWHLLIMGTESYNKLWNYLISLKINDMLVAFIMCFIAMTIGFFITYIQKKIPLFQKYV